MKLVNNNLSRFFYESVNNKVFGVNSQIREANNGVF